MPHAQSSLRKAFKPLTALIALFSLTACGHFGAQTPEDTVSGYYAGHWYGPNPEKPLGTLNCTITPTGPDQWQADFIATFGEVGEYEVPLEGRREDGKVLFGGDVNLGETDGVYSWTGEIVGDEFTGNYTSNYINGSFHMNRAEPPAEG